MRWDSCVLHEQVSYVGHLTLAGVRKIWSGKIHHPRTLSILCSVLLKNLVQMYSSRNFEMLLISQNVSVT